MKFELSFYYWGLGTTGIEVTLLNSITFCICAAALFAFYIIEIPTVFN